MNTLGIQRAPRVCDVVVIGPRAGGGTVAKVLTELGIEMALVEAGSTLDPARDYKEHMWPHAAQPDKESSPESTSQGV